MTFSGLNIHNCFFENCKSKSAGCLLCRENLTLLHVTFKDCKAKSDSGVFEQRSVNFKTKSDIKFCTFLNCKAKFYGGFHCINYGGEFKIETSNISGMEAIKNVAFFEIDNFSSSIQFLIVNNCHSSSTNGCITTKRMNSLLITNCLFKNCSQNTSKVNAAAVLLLSKNLKIAVVEKCFFLLNKPSNSTTISVKKDGAHALISNSFFTGEKKKEIYQNKQADVDDSVVFNFILDNEMIQNFLSESNKKRKRKKLKQNDGFIFNWKSDFKNKISNQSFGCMIDYLDSDDDFEDESDSIIDDLDQIKVIEEDLFIVHFIAFLFSLFFAFILQKMTVFK